MRFVKARSTALVSKSCSTAVRGVREISCSIAQPGKHNRTTVHNRVQTGCGIVGSWLVVFLGGYSNRTSFARWRGSERPSFVGYV